MNISNVLSRIKEHSFFSELFTMKALSQFGKYLATGSSAAVLEYSLLILLTEYVGMWYIISNSIAYFSGFWLSFLLHRFWSFKSQDPILKQLLLYILLFFINFTLTSLLLYTLTDMMGVYYMISKVFVMGSVVLWNFILYKKVIYRT